MSMILCRQEPVKHPYYMEGLGVHLYSSQELCYVIVNHPFLVIEDFVNASLIEFIRDDLDMAFLAGRLEKWREAGGSHDEMLMLILQECNYYTSQEVGRFRRRIEELRKMNPVDFQKARADYYFNSGKFGTAVRLYEKILDMPKDPAMTDSFMSRVWHNLGSAYAGLFYFDKAMHAYDKACGLGKDSTPLKQMYFLTLMAPGLVMKERYQLALSPEIMAIWEKEYNSIKEEAATSSKVLEIQENFEKDPIRRMSGASDKIIQWKQEYRKMI